MPFISVVVPVYKVKDFLRRCIDSVLNQTFPDFELILVDDGSPDNCGAICDEYAEKDSRIHVIHQENGGLSAARNAGLDVATGKYIYFLDSDDAIKPTLLEKALKYMEDGNDMAVFHYDNVYLKGDSEAVIYHTLGTFDITDVDKRKEFILCQLLTGKIGWEAWSRMYSREIIERYHLRFADNRRIFAEDLYFCLCYCAHARRIVSIQDSLYYYTIRENSIMGQDRNKVNVGRMVELAKVAREHFQQWDDCKLLLDCFPVVFYLIVSSALVPLFGYTHESRRAFPGKVYGDIQNVDYFNSQIKALWRFPREWRMAYKPSEAAWHKNLLRYLKDQNYFMFRAFNRLIEDFTPIMDKFS